MVGGGDPGLVQGVGEVGAEGGQGVGVHARPCPTHGRSRGYAATIGSRATLVGVPPNSVAWFSTPLGAFCRLYSSAPTSMVARVRMVAGTSASPMCRPTRAAASSQHWRT